MIAQNNKKKTKVALLALPAGIIMMICLGLLYAWSIFIIPLETDLGCPREAISKTFSVSLIGFCTGSLIIGKLLSHGFKFYFAVVLSGALLFSAFLLSSMAEKVWQIYMAYGILGGLGIGMGYNTIVTTVVNWFPSRRGIVSGILMMGYGLGPMLLGSLCSKIMAMIGWRSLFFYIACAFGIIFLSGSFILNRSFRMLNKDNGQKNVDIKNTKGLKLSQSMKRSDFLIYYLWTLFFGFCCLTFVGNIAPTAIEIGASTQTAAFLVGMVALFNGFGRILMGVGYDKMGLKKMLYMLSIAFFGVICCLCFASKIESTWFFSVVCGMMGLCFSGLPTSMAVFILERFGQKYYSENLAGFNTVMIPQAAGTALFANLAANAGSYSTAYLVFIPSGVIILITMFFLAKSLEKNKRILDI